VDEPDHVRADAGARRAQVVEERPGVLGAAVLQGEVEAAQAGELLEVGGREARRPGAAEDEHLWRLLEAVEEVRLDRAVVGDDEVGGRLGDVGGRSGMSCVPLGEGDPQRGDDDGDQRECGEDEATQWNAGIRCHDVLGSAGGGRVPARRGR